MRLSLTFVAILLSSIVLISCSSKPEPEAAEVLSKATIQPAAAKMPDAAEYLAKAAAEPGARKTASGLVYHELKPGIGASPKATDTVTVNYRGTLLDGSEFDSSYKTNAPATFPLNRVIPCWTEGVQMMKVGGKSQLVCPAVIAYGEAGSPPVIPGGATLIFEIELLGIEH
jgi:FKBP-type peptidyl-prolyl cis-trans isomerase FkpA